MKTQIAVDSFIYSRMALGRVKNTVSWYSHILKRFILKYPNLPSHQRQIEEFIVSCTGGDEYRRGYYRTLHAFYRYIEKRFKLKKNPLKDIGMPGAKRKLPRPITLEQLNQLLLFPHKQRIKASLYFLSGTGVRLGELVHLNPEDIYETPLGFIARINVKGKTGERLVPVSAEIYHMIIGYLPLRISRPRMSHLITKAFKEAHVPGSAINLRHTFATYWQGEDIEILKRIMGHRRIETTMIYKELQTDTLLKAYNQYSVLQTSLPFSRTML